MLHQETIEGYLESYGWKEWNRFATEDGTGDHAIFYMGEDDRVRATLDLVNETITYHEFNVSIGNAVIWERTYGTMNTKHFRLEVQLEDSILLSPDDVLALVNYRFGYMPNR